MGIESTNVRFSCSSGMTALRNVSCVMKEDDKIGRIHVHDEYDFVARIKTGNGMVWCEGD